MLVGLDGEYFVVGVVVMFSDGVVGLSCCFFLFVEVVVLCVELLDVV